MKKPDLMSPMEDAQLERPTATRSRIRGLDDFLRSRGYTIRDRPNDGEPVWERSGIAFTQSAVLLRTNMEEFILARGYRIHTQPLPGRTGETIWKRDGNVYTKLDVLVNMGLLTEEQAAA